MPVTQAFPESTGLARLGSNWRVQFQDADGIPLNMVSFEQIDFGAVSYKEIFQNVKTILATPLYSAALERTLGIDQTIVDLPIDNRGQGAPRRTIAILDAITWWEPRVEVMNIDFDYSDALNGHLIVNLQLKIRNVIYGTDTPYAATHVFAVPTKPKQETPPMIGKPVLIPGPPGPAGETGPRGSLWFTGDADPVPPGTAGAVQGAVANDLYLNTVTGDVFVFEAAAPTGWRRIGNKSGRQR
jgi:phage baseplate assembly protein W